MKSVLKSLGLGTLLFLLPYSYAYAAAPTVSAISDVHVNAGATLTVNVVALDADGDMITLSTSNPAFVTLNAPTTGTGSVVTTMTLAPLAANVGTFSGSVTATAGGQATTENFLITVVEAGADHAPVVTAPATANATVGTNLTFTVTASDADANAITSLTATGAPLGATFTPNGSYTSGTFSWTPTAGQAGLSYDVIFTAGNALSGSATTHIEVAPVSTTVSIAPISDLTVVEGNTATVNVNVTATAGATVNLTSSLPSFATLNAPTSGTGGVNTTIHVAPLAGSAGTYSASVTATANGASATETFQIIVTAAGNDAPVVDAPGSRTVNEGSTLTFTVTATDADGDHVALSATGGVPAGATFTDHGDNTGTFTWTPGSTQAGTYTVTFTGNDGLGGIDTDATVITVLDVGGGGPGNATAVLQGNFNTHKKRICFKVRPTNGSFDVRNVTLGSIALNFGGQSITALARHTHLTFDCDGDGHDGDDGDDGDCDDRHDAARFLLGGGHHGHGDHDDDCDCDCDACDDEDEDESDCTAVGIRACFSMEDVLELFGDEDLPESFVDATIVGNLSGGGTFTATIRDRFPGNNGHGHANHKGMNPKARPNPLNPKTELTFTLHEAGRVQVAVYDLQGRLVSRLLDEVRAAGEQKVTWDGSNVRNERVSSGVYFFRIQAKEGKEIKRVAVVK